MCSSLTIHTERSVLVCLDGIDSSQEVYFSIGRLSLVLGEVADFFAGLSPSEQVITPGNNPARQQQFASGRRVAKCALQRLGNPTKEILKLDKRPKFPTGTVGNIAHSKRLAFAAAGKSEDFLGIGVDILPVNAVSSKVAKKALLEEEQKVVSMRGDPNLNTVYFCAKEAVYKAVHPLTLESLTLPDAHVDFDEAAHTFKVRSTTTLRSTKLVETGLGFFREVAGHWLTLFVVKR